MSRRTVPTDDLVRMANQIAAFFEPYPEEEAIAGVTEHLRKFWDPSMRTALIAAHRAGPTGLHRLASHAVDRLTDAHT
jgi:formate dehydrogenase subunit delta